jgi:hypothetical protein
MGPGKAVDARVSRKSGNQGQAAFVKKPFDFKGISADVVFPEQVDFEFALGDGVVVSDDMGENAVVCNVMAG